MGQTKKQSHRPRDARKLVRGPNQMNSPHWSQRELLEVTGAGILATNAMNYTASAQEDTSGGEEIWSFETGKPILSSPTVVDGTVYFGSHDSSVYALDAANGDEEWTFETGRGVESSPNVVDNSVLIGDANTDVDAVVYALDATAGDQEWTFGTAHGGAVISSPTVSNGIVFVGIRSVVYALDAATGDEVWTFETDGSVYSSPTVVNGIVFVASGAPDIGNVDALDAGVEGSSECWRVNLGPLGHHQRWANSQSKISIDDSQIIILISLSV